MENHPTTAPATLTTLPESATLSRKIVLPNGMLDALAMSRTLGCLVNEVLTGQIQSSRAHAAIHGLRTLVLLSDAVRRSSNAAQSLLVVNEVLPAQQLTNGD
jgi:hypothetical protein